MWLFGDTFPNEDVLLSATAAWSSAGEPTRLAEPFDAAGVPVSLYAYTPSETAFNQAHAELPVCCRDGRACPSDEPYCRCGPDSDCAARIALWPGSILPTDDGRLIGLYEKVKAGAAAWDFDVLGIGTFTLLPEDVTTRRTLDRSGEPILLFERGEPKFLHAVRVDDDDGTWAYVFGETAGGSSCSSDVYVGRAPLADMQERNAYRFWDGKGWAETLAEAAPVLDDVEGGLGSVAYNEYLGAYLSGTVGLCTEGAQFLMRSAPRPQGPWSAPIAVDLSTLGASSEAYAGLLHPALGVGRRIVISFYEPLFQDERVLGRVRLARLELKRRRVGIGALFR